MRWRGMRQIDSKIERDEAERNVQAELMRQRNRDKARLIDGGFKRQKNRQMNG
jgi:hypothetical protein